MISFVVCLVVHHNLPKVASLLVCEFSAHALLGE